MNACLEALKDINKLVVWVLTNNENAISFYKHIGFESDGMSKVLDLKITTLNVIR